MKVNVPSLGKGILAALLGKANYIVLTIRGEVSSQVIHDLSFTSQIAMLNGYLLPRQPRLTHAALLGKRIFEYIAIINDGNLLSRKFKAWF